ncbi:unnamed protein product [Brugia pahangi]|uniref:Nuclear transport factor 2 family protein n=1 Tax=Brugia pahangi TaxID=6280 RepID=A0A0N4T4F7_BRUPA|nr:unnamed protein product [Brugia pahangi]
MKSSGAHGNVVGDASALENEDENKYLDQVRHILMNGERIDDLSGQFHGNTVVAEYRGMDADYINQGIDQLSEIIDLMKNEPHNRCILNAWNVI